MNVMFSHLKWIMRKKSSNAWKYYLIPVSAWRMERTSMHRNIQRNNNDSPKKVWWEIRIVKI